MPAKQRTGHVDRIGTKTAGVFYRGTNNDRRYEVTWRCHGTCGNPKHRAKGNGQHWERAHGDYRDACELLGARRAEVRDRRARAQRGEGVAPAKTFAEVTAEYRGSGDFRGLAGGTPDRYRRDQDAYVLPTFGHMLVGDIRASHIRGWLDYLRRGYRRQRPSRGRTTGLSESALNSALTALRVVLRYAAEADPPYIDHNPVEDVKARHLPKPDEDKREKQVLDEDQLDRLAAAAESPYRLIFQAAMWTGLRSSELRGLTWGDLDRRVGWVTVTRQMDHKETGRRVPLKAKGLSDKREVPLVPELAEALHDHRARLAEHDRAKPTDWVFQDGDGGHLRNEPLGAALNRAVEAAGIERDAEKALSLHALRHGFGSIQLARGRSLVWVSQRLGHTKLSTTERWYVHEIEALSDREAEAMRADAEARRARRSAVTV
jgi:integrase